MNLDANFQPYLIPGELLRWSASVRVPFFQQIRSFLPMLALFLVLFLIFFWLEVGATSSRKVTSEITPVVAEPGAQPESFEKKDKSEPASTTEVIVMSAIGALFFSSFLTLWLVMMYNGLIRDYFKERFTYPASQYGLTQHRLIWINGERNRRIYSYPLFNMEHFRLDEGPNGIGDIYITLKPHGPHNPFQPPPFKTSQPVLRSIPDAAQFYRHLFQAKMEAKD